MAWSGAAASTGKASGIWACRILGGILTPSNADVCAVFSLFPNYPITLKLWFADEEIPGSGRLFLDRCASHYLTVEDAVTAGSLLMEALFQELNASGF